MANVLVDEQVLKDIADEIRMELGQNDKYKPADMPEKVADVYWQGIIDGEVDGWNNGFEDGYYEGYKDGKTEGGDIIDVVSLPTGDINEDAIYRVLNAAFFDGKKFRNNAFCNVVDWGADPTAEGEEAFQEIDGVATNFSYYDAIDGVIWFYFGNGSRQVLKNMIDAREGLSTLEKIAAKAIVSGLSGWKTKDELMNLVGNSISLPGGKVIYSLDEVTDVDEEYLLLYYEMFVYENGEWVNIDRTDEYASGLVEGINSTVDDIIAMQESLIGGDEV